MSIRTLIENYRELRQSPIWRLLAADTGPQSIAILQTLLFDNERELPASVFLERLIHAYAEGAQETISRDEARALASRWVKEGYLVCRLAEGRSEETYELTSAGQEAIRTLSRFQTKRTGPTESRLEMVTHAIERLAADSDRSRAGRIAQLKAEKARIDEEIAAIEAGRSPSISEQAALDRVSEIFDLVSELEADFRRVREEFERLNRDLRERILKSLASRGSILDRFFAGVDGISESDAGRAFTAFYRLLMDNRASAELESALTRIAQRGFYRKLTREERRRLSTLQRMLLDRAGHTHAVMTQLAKSLRDFVSSRDYVEERRLTTLIRDARRAALDLSKTVGIKEGFMEVTLSSAVIRSIDQYSLDDPEETRMESDIAFGSAPEVDAFAIFERILASEIDYPQLMRSVESVLTAPGAPERASIGDIYRSLANQQGLGSVVGLLSLATRYGEPGGPGMPALRFSDVKAKKDVPETDMSDPKFRVPLQLPAVDEPLVWKDRLQNERHARIPLYWFTLESVEKMRESHRWR